MSSSEQNHISIYNCPMCTVSNNSGLLAFFFFFWIWSYYVLCYNWFLRPVYSTSHKATKCSYLCQSLVHITLPHPSTLDKIPPPIAAMCCFALTQLETQLCFSSPHAQCHIWQPNVDTARCTSFSSLSTLETHWHISAFSIVALRVWTRGRSTQSSTLISLSSLLGMSPKTALDKMITLC